jgi:hypothetical protein
MPYHHQKLKNNYDNNDFEIGALQQKACHTWLPDRSIGNIYTITLLPDRSIGNIYTITLFSSLLIFLVSTISLILLHNSNKRSPFSVVL